MKCKQCGKKAVIRLRAHNIALCEEDFFPFILNRVQRTIERYKLFAPSEKILVAVSGGKDSLALFDILQRLGYPVEGFHIDMGIDGFSQRAQEIVEEFLAERRASLYRHSLREEAGAGVAQISRRLRRPPCSLCGMIRRYIMNRFAVERGFSTVVTGHNLDDEGATLLGNLTNWQVGYLARQSPLLPATHPRLAKKAKPLALVSEREVLAYCLLRGIVFHDERCPHSKGATSRKHKEVLNLIEYFSPGSKIRFYQEFLKNQGIFSGRERGEMRGCTLCGFPTTRDTCQFCTALERVRGLGIPS